VIICGFRPLVEETIDVLKLHGVPYVILEENKEIIQELEEREMPYVMGDPTEEDTLKRAFIDDAIALIAAMDDESNAFICLTAKSLRDDLQIVASAENVESVRALFAANASKIVVPKLFAGNLLGQRACHDYSIGVSGKFARFGDLEVRQYAIGGDSPLRDLPLAESRIHSQAGAIIAGLWKEGQLILNPEPDQQLTEGTTIVALGTEHQLDALYRLVRGG
jgi:Trk K+ transport system NAD-binding subunit